MRNLRILLAAMLMLALGCGGSAKRDFAMVGAPAGAQPKAKQAEAAAGNAAPAEDAVQRKIIYSAQVVLIVEDLDQGAAELDKLVQEQKCLVAKADIQGTRGYRRSGSWTIRVPVDHFRAFLDAVAKLGELQRRSIDSEDITDKYYDLSARLKNNEVEREALRKLIEKTTSSPDALAALRRELRELQGTIESQKGQINMWDQLTALATVTISMTERKDYVPEPDFSTSIGRTFSNSWNALIEFGKGVVLVVVALVPWSPIIALVVGVPWWLIRRALRRWREHGAVTLEAVPPPAAPTPTEAG